MQNVRERLIAKMREAATDATRHNNTMAMAVPLGPLADAALSVFADGATVPTIARYDHDLAQMQRWYGQMTPQEIEEYGLANPSISVTRDGEHAVVHVEHQGRTIDLRMLPHEAAQFGLCVASAAMAQDTPAPDAVRADAVRADAARTDGTPGTDA